MKNQNKSHSNKHLITMALGCIVPLVLLYAASVYFGFSTNYMLWGAILLMIIMHIWMMKGHNEKHKHER